MQLAKSPDGFVNEMTTTNGAGAYTIPMSPGLRIFDKNSLNPYNKKVSKYNDAELAVDSYDGKLDVSKSKASKMEKNALKISKYIKWATNVHV